MLINSARSNDISWHQVNVHTQLPAELEKLNEMAYNLWWVWNSPALSIFRHIESKEVWHSLGSNPIVLLHRLSYEKIQTLCKDKVFVDNLNSVYSDFKAYMNTPCDKKRPSIVYFSMEYGLANILKIYSGGLGILAGDYLKEASDSNVDLTAIGLLYRYGYFTQTLSPEGNQIANYEAQNFNDLPITQVLNKDGSPLQIEVPYPNRTVYANVWVVNVGRIKLYLLDTDNDKNSDWDRTITHQLYGGDNENRIRQEILLGIGGVLMLNKLGIKKDVYHCNEGHAALMGLQRLVDLIEKEQLTFNQALEVVRASGLYTCHTPVPAGHDYFPEDLFYKYMSSYPARLGIEWHDLIGMGRSNPDNNQEKFSMSVFALNTCQEANGVSKLHGEVSQKMFAPIWKGYFPEELHVGYVTNGVHMATWTAHEWKKIYAETFPKEWIHNLSDMSMWEAYSKLPDKVVWDAHIALKKKLIEFLLEQFKISMRTQTDPDRIVQAATEMNEKTLIIGFGRRFATYKRAHLLFTDLNRLEKIVNDPEKPIQFLFTGKAHPADGAGQGLIRRIIEISRMPQFLGKIIFLENYDMRLAKRLISGVDIWLNTPTRPLEASGTSGQKAQMNGVLNLSIMDGWWYEGYVEGAGWAISDKRIYDNQEYQDRLDATTIYNMLELTIAPLYYKQNKEGYSPEWIQYIKNSITKITPRFTTKRMMDDYYDKFYNKLRDRHNFLLADGYAKAKEIVAWKENMAAHWNEIEVVEVSMPSQQSIRMEEKYPIKVVLDTHGLNDKGIGVELVAFSDDKFIGEKLLSKKELQLTNTVGSILTFELTNTFNYAGGIKLGLRMYAKNDLLPHRMDFAYVRWL